METAKTYIRLIDTVYDAVRNNYGRPINLRGLSETALRNLSNDAVYSLWDNHNDYNQLVSRVALIERKLMKLVNDINEQRLHLMARAIIATAIYPSNSDWRSVLDKSSQYLIYHLR